MTSITQSDDLDHAMLIHLHLILCQIKHMKMGQPTHKQYAIATYMIIILMILFAIGMMALVVYNV